MNCYSKEQIEKAVKSKGYVWFDGADDATVTSVTKRVNGGTIGLADRIKHFKEYYNLLK